jgi:hypothetical protein
MSGKDQHVAPRSGKWSVRSAGADRAFRLVGTQKEAISIGRERARSEKSELFIHGADGRIRERNSFGSDPCPPKDKR